MFNLLRLSKRRLRGDLIEAFKLMKEIKQSELRPILQGELGLRNKEAYMEVSKG